MRIDAARLEPAFESNRLTVTRSLKGYSQQRTRASRFVLMI